jgi:hypothetical protein
MKKTTLLANVVIAFSMLGCAMAQSPVNGFLYSDVKHSGGATEAYGGSARGEACASSILGLIANGDASIDTAKKNGMVMQVTAVDHTSSNILGFYAKYCTIVYGKKGTGGGAAPAAKGGGEG